MGEAVIGATMLELQLLFEKVLAAKIQYEASKEVATTDETLLSAGDAAATLDEDDEEDEEEGGSIRVIPSSSSSSSIAGVSTVSGSAGEPHPLPARACCMCSVFSVFDI